MGGESQSQTASFGFCRDLGGGGGNISQEALRRQRLIFKLFIDLSCDNFHQLDNTTNTITQNHS